MLPRADFGGHVGVSRADGQDEIGLGRSGIVRTRFHCEWLKTAMRPIRRMVRCIHRDREEHPVAQRHLHGRLVAEAGASVGQEEAEVADCGKVALWCLQHSF